MGVNKEMTFIAIKSVGIWLLIVFAAIFNGVAREKLLTPLLGSGVSLPLSGVTLSALVLIITYFTLPLIGEVKPGVYLFIGLLWVALTLVFEYVFGYYLAGKPWHEINQVFNLRKGNLFILVLIVSGVSPWIAAKMKHLI